MEIRQELTLRAEEIPKVPDLLEKQIQDLPILLLQDNLTLHRHHQAEAEAQAQEVLAEEADLHVAEVEVNITHFNIHK